MTDEANALVERLRWGEWYFEDPFDGKAYASDDPLDAANLIKTQAREIERLRKANNALTSWLLHRFGPDTPEGKEAQVARAALGDTHD